jgi:hypothetical protein
MTDTPDIGLPETSFTTPVTVFTWAVDSREMETRERNNISLRRELWPNGGGMCRIIAIVLEFNKTYSKLGQKT